MIPVIALVGRPNVGKSTLFNRLTKTRNAIVASVPGLTRDRQYGKGTFEDREFILIDTGGLSGEDQGIDGLMAGQTHAAIAEADLVFFLVDAQAGRTGGDEWIAEMMRRREKAVVLLANKCDGANPDFVNAEFLPLGFGNPMCIAAKSGDGVRSMMTALGSRWPQKDADPEVTASLQGIRIVVVGRPNVGKSTLVNRMLGEERVVVSPEAGTTRDSIYIPFERGGRHYTLIDTAGVRRRGRVSETAEKFSIVKTLEAVQNSDVAILLLDGVEGVVEQDLHLVSYLIEAGRALVIAVNKWDGLPVEQRESVKSELDRRLEFLDYADRHFISALHGSGVGLLYDSIETAYACATMNLRTSRLNQILERAVADHPPPLVHGRRIKLRYANVGGHRPPLVVIHGNQTDALPESYKRYLANCFVRELELVGTPIRIEFKTSGNPFAGRKNRLSPRQERKRARMVNHVRKQGRKRGKT